MGGRQLLVAKQHDEGDCAGAILLLRVKLAAGIMALQVEQVAKCTRGIHPRILTLAIVQSKNLLQKQRIGAAHHCCTAWFSHCCSVDRHLCARSNRTAM